MFLGLLLSQKVGNHSLWLIGRWWRRRQRPPETSRKVRSFKVLNHLLECITKNLVWPIIFFLDHSRTMFKILIIESNEHDIIDIQLTRNYDLRRKRWFWICLRFCNWSPIMNLRMSWNISHFRWQNRKASHGVNFA